MRMQSFKPFSCIRLDRESEPANERWNEQIISRFMMQPYGTVIKHFSTAFPESDAIVVNARRILWFP